MQDSSLQHNLYNVTICNGRMKVTKRSGLRCNYIDTNWTVTLGCLPQVATVSLSQALLYSIRDKSALNAEASERRLVGYNRWWFW